MTSAAAGRTPERILACVATAHERERTLIGRLSVEEMRAPSNLPGWTRAHVVSARRAFARAALRQSKQVLAGQAVEFFDGGRDGRDREIEEGASLQPETLVADLVAATRSLERVLGHVEPADWSREASYRGTATLLDVLLGEWRETELHMVDLRAGATPSGWSRSLCAQLFEFLEPRVPPELTLVMCPVGEEPFQLGRGAREVRLTAARHDLAAWLAGRPSVGPVRSSTGALPPLGRLRDAAR